MDDITGYDGEKIGEIRDYHNESGKYLGTTFIGAEGKGCLEALILLPFMGVMYYVYQIIFG